MPAFFSPATMAAAEALCGLLIHRNSYWDIINFGRETSHILLFWLDVVKLLNLRRTLLTHE